MRVWSLGKHLTSWRREAHLMQFSITREIKHAITGRHLQLLQVLQKPAPLQQQKKTTFRWCTVTDWKTEHYGVGTVGTTPLLNSSPALMITHTNTGGEEKLSERKTETREDNKTSLTVAVACPNSHWSGCWETDPRPPCIHQDRPVETSVWSWSHTHTHNEQKSYASFSSDYIRLLFVVIMNFIPRI